MATATAFLPKAVARRAKSITLCMSPDARRTTRHSERTCELACSLRAVFRKTLGVQWWIVGRNGFGAVVVVVCVVGTAGTAQATRCPAGTSVRLAAVGDVLFGRYLSPRRYRRVPRIERPFQFVAPWIRGAELAFANLESPIVPHPTRVRTHRMLTFRAQPADADVLASAGFDVISLANNHAGDMGRKGAAQSHDNILKAGMQPVGVGATVRVAEAPAIVVRRGVRVAFIARTVWLRGDKRPSAAGAIAYVRPSQVAQLADQLRALRERTLADFVVVSLHWGVEGARAPQSHQRAAARRLIDHGADVILGHHPHVLQPIERYRHGVIAYSLGNFMFDNPDVRQRDTVVFEVELRKNGDRRCVGALRLYPFTIDARRGVPRTVVHRRRATVARALSELAPDAVVHWPERSQGSQ